MDQGLGAAGNRVGRTRPAAADGNARLVPSRDRHRGRNAVGGDVAVLLRGQADAAAGGRGSDRSIADRGKDVGIDRVVGDGGGDGQGSAVAVAAGG